MEKEIIELLRSTKRERIEELIAFLRRMGEEISKKYFFGSQNFNNLKSGLYYNSSVLNISNVIKSMGNEKIKEYLTLENMRKFKLNAKGITSLINTLGKDEKLDVIDAIKAVTINSAYQYFEENIKGSIEIGKFCDLVILENDILSVDVNKIKDIKVLATIIDGNIVYGGI